MTDLERLEAAYKEAEKLRKLYLLRIWILKEAIESRVGNSSTTNV